MQVNPMIWEHAFSDFLSKGYTPEDLQLVLGHLLRENRRMNGAKYSLRLNTLLDWQYERFDSFLAEARAVKRNRVVRSGGDVALSEWRGVETKTAAERAAVPARDVLKKVLEGLP